MKIIGIDYSTNVKKCGLVIAEYVRSEVNVDYIGVYNKKVIDKTLRSTDSGLLAIDAPLGWPSRLTEYLAEHKAGQGIQCEANRLFRRYTDAEVKRITGKQSLDVGADKIARTAHGAVNLLDTLRKNSHYKFPMIWNNNSLVGKEFGVAEVYPAATLKQNGLPFTQYKDKKGFGVRQEILDGLKKKYNIILPPIHSAIEDDNILDALVCVVAGIDLLDGRCYEPPEDMFEVIQQEGWIWVTSVQNSI